METDKGRGRPIGRKAIVDDKDGYVMLAKAIVQQAALDYRNCLFKEGRDNLSEYARDQNKLLKDDCEKFFQSKWMEELSDIDGEYLMRKIREEYEN